MTIPYTALGRAEFRIAANEVTGPFEWWRHTPGHGGINSLPLPERVIEGARRLRPRLIRTFLQEFLRVYPESGVFDWSRSDPYIEALAATGAGIVAAITLKPGPLFPVIDHRVWQPTDRAEWQRALAALVQRYSVERHLVSHWEIGNETDIGEWGGSPFLIDTAEDYFEYYRTMVEAIRGAFPGARVGGPALASTRHELLPGFLRLCRETGTPLDFISWHLYHNDPQEHRLHADYVRGLLAEYPGSPPELMVTEWNKGFDSVSLAEMAFESGRAAHTAATILTMMEAGVDASFYYHVWDQTAYIDEFSPFFSDPSIMTVHWNEIPHRFGLFGVAGEVRPQYFVYQALSRMGDERLRVEGAHVALHTCAVRSETGVSVLLANYQREKTTDLVVDLRFSGLPQSRKLLRTHRIDSDRRWSDPSLEMVPLEEREIDTYDDYHCQVLCPAQTVTMVSLENEGVHTGEAKG